MRARTNPSRKVLKSAILASLAAAAMLFALMVLRISFPGDSEFAVQAAAAPAIPAIAQQNDLADQMFIYSAPAIIAFLVYLSFMIARLVSNLENVKICGHSNPCGHEKSYFLKKKKVVVRRKKDSRAI